MKAMRQICQVLLFISEQKDWISNKEIAIGTGLTIDQAQEATKQLTVKQKIQKRIKKHVGNVYLYVDELVEASPRPTYVKCSSPVAKALEARVPSQLANSFRFAQQKINLLERLKDKVGTDDKDLIIGIINDYSFHTKKAG